MPTGCDVPNPDICCPIDELNDGGTLFPAIPGEDSWPDALRGFLYLIFMLWCFLGVAIVADLFMGGIEQVCTATYVKTGKDGKQRVFKKWNPVVANLSLMALGSSAPEILLNVMEILFNDFKAGALGPSTIVGSAAFNLLVIIAVCVVSIKKTDTDPSGVRKIEGMRVYIVTASFSVFAYLWLLIILAYWTKDIVTVEEAVITFMLFWVVLFLAYAADKNFFRGEPEGEESAYAKKAKQREAVALEKMKSLKAAGIDPAKASAIVQDLVKPTTPATYTREAMGLLTGKKKRAMIGPNGKAVNTGTTVANLKKIMPAPAAKVAPADGVEALAESSVKGCKVMFAEEAVSCTEACGKVELEVVRTGLCDEEASVEFKTENGSAMAGKDYKEAGGTINFPRHNSSQYIEVDIVDDDKIESDEMFKVILMGDTAKQCEVGKTGNIARVTIKSDDKGDAKAAFVASFVNQDKCDVIMEEWKQQFKDAISPGANEADGEPPSKLALVMHVLTVFWKVVFATVPPPQLWGGWGAFCVALGYIAVMTIIVGDICALFGCIIGLKAEVTAITFVALGTSMPDLFASKAAAVSEPDADNSVGNVTGSNCVNVFLGLGLPWLIAAAYWTASGPNDDWYESYLTGPTVSDSLKESLKEYAPGGSNYGDAVFVVESGNLGLAVIVFICCSLTCLATLALRRKFCGGELGGPDGPKYATALLFVLLWGLYVIISSLATEGIIDGEM